MPDAPDAGKADESGAGSGRVGAPSDFYRPFGRLPGRRRLLILLLAVAMAVTVVITLLHPPGGVQRKRPPPPPDVAACGPGQSEGCVGSMSEVLVPEALTASAPRR